MDGRTDRQIGRYAYAQIGQEPYDAAHHGKEIVTNCIRNTTPDNIKCGTVPMLQLNKGVHTSE